MTSTLTRAQRADNVRPLVAAEFDRIRREATMAAGDVLTVMGLHLREVSERLDKPLVALAYGSVQHLLHGHAGLHCCCQDNVDGGECSAVPVGYVLDAFEAAASDYPITDPRKKLNGERKPTVSRKDPLAAMVASGLVSSPRNKTAFRPWKAA